MCVLKERFIAKIRSLANVLVMVPRLHCVRYVNSAAIMVRELVIPAPAIATVMPVNFVLPIQIRKHDGVQMMFAHLTNISVTIMT